MGRCGVARGLALQMAGCCEGLDHAVSIWAFSAACLVRWNRDSWVVIVTVKVLLRFFKRLIKDAKRKVFMILDNLRVHHAHLVRDWLALHRDEIEVYYLPSYSPEMNPDECLNGDLKHRIRSAAPARNLKQLEKTVVGHMRMLQKKPGRVKSYFRHPDIAYAA